MRSSGHDNSLLNWMALNSDAMMRVGLLNYARLPSQLELCTPVEAQRIKRSFDYKVETVKSPCDGSRKRDNTCFPCSLLIHWKDSSSLNVFWSARENKSVLTLTADQEIIEVREQILHLGLKPKVIPLKLFFDMVLSSSIEFFNTVMQRPLVQTAAEWSRVLV